MLTQLMLEKGLIVIMGDWKDDDCREREVNAFNDKAFSLGDMNHSRGDAAN